MWHHIHNIPGMFFIIITQNIFLDEKIHLCFFCFFKKRGKKIQRVLHVRGYV
jgi:hypothetical protein